MPSWVPDWQSKVESEAYKFATGRRDHLASDSFRFLDDGKTLMLLAFDLGGVSEVRGIAPNVVHSTTWHYVSDKMFVLPAEVKALVTKIVSGVLTDTTIPGSEIPRALRELKIFLATALDGGKKYLQDHSTSVLHYARSGIEEPAFVKAGEARQGDRIVFVPGCYHQLVLRAVSGTSGRSEWGLVGLVIIFNVARDGRTKGGFSKVAWENLPKQRALSYTPLHSFNNKR